MMRAAAVGVYPFAPFEGSGGLRLPSDPWSLVQPVIVLGAAPARTGAAPSGGWPLELRPSVTGVGYEHGAANAVKVPWSEYQPFTPRLGLWW